MLVLIGKPALEVEIKHQGAQNVAAFIAEPIVGATAARDDWVDLLWEVTGDLNHGGMFSHHAVAATAGLVILEYIVTRDPIARAETLGARLDDKLHAALEWSSQRRRCARSNSSPTA